MLKDYSLSNWISILNSSFFMLLFENHHLCVKWHMTYMKTCFCGSSASSPTPITPSWPLKLLPSSVSFFLFYLKSYCSARIDSSAIRLVVTPELSLTLTSVTEDTCELLGTLQVSLGAIPCRSLPQLSWERGACSILILTASQRPTKFLLNIQNTRWRKSTRRSEHGRRPRLIKMAPVTSRASESSSENLPQQGNTFSCTHIQPT